MATADGREGGDAAQDVTRPSERASPEARAEGKATGPLAQWSALEADGGESPALQSWSHLAALAGPEAPSAVEEALRTGGLLGVDADLLRFLEVDGPGLAEAPTQPPRDDEQPQVAPPPVDALEVEATAVPEATLEGEATRVPEVAAEPEDAAEASEVPWLDDGEPPLLDTWGGGGDEPQPAPRVDSLPPLAPPDRLQELDPFAAPVGAGLPDELEGIDDPFDSVSMLPAPAVASLGEAWVGHATTVAEQPRPPALPGLAPSTPPESVSWLAPEADEVAAARTLLAARSRERRGRLGEAARDADVLVVEEVLHDGEDRRVTRIEYPSLDDLDVEEVRTEAPPPEPPPEPADVVPVDEPVSPLERLSLEPVDLDAPAPEAPPATPPAEPSALEAGDDEILSVVPLDERLHPAWEGEVSAAAPIADLERLLHSGVPFLGAVPRYEPVRGVASFPPGSPAAIEPAPAAGPPLVPELPRPAGGDPATLALVERLNGEIRAETDRSRMALLLHELGRLARDALDDEELALAALRAAQTNDPGFQLNRWGLHELLFAVGRPDEVVAHLARHATSTRGEADRLCRAAHVAAARLHDPARAAGLLQRAADLEPGALAPLLARYLLHVGQVDWEAALPVLQAAIEAAEGATLTGVLLLDAIRLLEELGAPPASLAELHQRALVRIGGSPALLASLERHVAEHGGLELLLTGLRARFDAVMAGFQRGHMPEDEAKREVGEVFYKAAWALERLGRRAEALREYQNALQTLPNDPYVLYRAADLARRLGRAEEQRAALERMAALARDPGEAANALYQMGLLAQKVLADEQQATLDFERALAVLPSFTPALAALGRQSIRQGRWHDVYRRYTGEIAQLEEALAGEQPPETRSRTIRGLLSRYYRTARLLADRLEDPEGAIGYHKRALALAPDFSPSFFELERLYEGAGRWRELVALDLGLVERLDADADPGPFLLRAADVLRTRLRDDLNAGRVFARVLARTPDHRAALEGASEVFERLGNRAAQVEVDARWARSLTEPAHEGLAVALWVRAGEMQELDGDPLAAAAEALPLFREALTRRPAGAAAFDGLLRTSVRLGRVGELARQARDPATARALPSLLLLLAAEAMVAAGSFAAAADVLRQWRDRFAAERATLPVAAEASTDRAALALLVLAYERAEAWRPLADALEEVASRTADARARAALLVRVGELWEHRLDQLGLADDAYLRALAADPGAEGAREGRERIAVRRGEDPPAAPGDAPDLEQLVTGARSGDPAATRALSEALAEVEPAEAAALAWVAARGAPDEDAARAAFEAQPDRRDRFEAWWTHLEDRPAERLAALRLRLPHEDEAGRLELLAAALGLAEAMGDAGEIRDAAEALLDADPGSLPAALALRSLGGDEALAAGERLAGILQTPRRAAALFRKLAGEAEQAGQGPARARALLEQAIELDPSDPEAGAELESRLRATGDWPELLALYDRQLLATTDAAALRRVQLAKADLLAGELGDPVAALPCCLAVLEILPDDAEAAMRAAMLAEGLGDRAHALDLLARAATAADPQARADVAVRRAALLSGDGDVEGARRLLEALVAEQPDRRDALELLADVRAAARDWSGVVEVLRRLYALETDPHARAGRAAALGEVLSRVHGEHRLAAGWFKRAVELAPASVDALWRLLEEAERAPPGAVPVEHVADAIDRALGGVRERLADDPFDVRTIADLSRLVRARGDADAWFVTCGALVHLGAARDDEAAYFHDRRERLAADFTTPLDPDRRRRLLCHPGETGLAPSLFAPFALVLTELLAERMPAGATRLSGRSFARWQADFRQLAAGLDMAEVEAWQIGARSDRLGGHYLPRPAIEASTRLLEQGVDARQAFRLGRLLEGLRDGRLLLAIHGPDTIAACVARMAQEVAPAAARGIGLPAAPLDRALAELEPRLVDRARRLPRRIQLMLDTLPGGYAGHADFPAFAAAVEATCDRAGLLACGDVGVALDEILHDAGVTAEGDPAARREQLAALPEARRLLAFALDPAYLELRRALGLAVSG
jgi:tetratricopeptide (TPR) repeat protein